MQQMLATMGSSELSEWMAFDSLEPFGERRADLRAGIVASTVANSGMRPPRNPARAIDFMPFMEPDAPVKLADPVAHGNLIAKTLFGSKVRRVRSRR